MCILAGILLISFSACSGNDLIVDAPDKSGTTANTSEDLSSNGAEELDVPENYALGTFDGALFCSEWLGLNFQLPYGWTTVSEDNRKKVNDTAIPAYKNGKSEEIYYLEISAFEDNGKGGAKDQNSLEISIRFKSSVETLDGYIEKYKKSMEEMYVDLESKGVKADVVWDALSEYSLAEQDYILCKSTVSSQYQWNGHTEKYRIWDLWQEKDGGYICIQCEGYEDSNILQHLSYIQKYGDSVSTGNSTDGSTDSSTDSSANGSPSSATSDPTDSTTSNSTDGSTDQPQNNDPCASGHNWVEITETVYHDVVGHYEPILVKEREEWYKCPGCSETFYSLDAYYSHFDSNHSNLYFWRDDFTHGTNWEEYEDKWIVDQEAYDETVTTGYQCSVCGQQK